MSATTDFENARVNVAPVFDVLQFGKRWHSEFFGEFNQLLFIFFDHFEQTLGDDSC